VIVHFEGISFGTNENVGNRYQNINHEKFSTKWLTALKQRQNPPASNTAEVMLQLALGGSNSRQKRALICMPLLPEFDREAGSRRQYHTIQMLQQQGWSVSILVQNASNGERYIRLLQQQGVAVFSGDMFADPALSEMLLRAGQFNLVIAVFWEIAEFLIRHVREQSSKTKFVVDSIDIQFLRYARDVFLKNSLINQEMATQYMRELNVYDSADAVLAVSEKEKTLLNDFLINKQHVHCVPLSEELPPSPVPFSERRGLLFVGNFRHPPNVQ